MSKATHRQLEGQENIEVKSALEEILRSGARQMLQKAIEFEVADYIDRHRRQMHIGGCLKAQILDLS